MTVTIEVRPDVEARLRRRAAREGRAFEAVASQAVEVGTDVIEPVAPDIAARLAAMSAFVAEAREYSQAAPVLSDYATTRGAIYDGRGL